MVFEVPRLGARGISDALWRELAIENFSRWMRSSEGLPSIWTYLKDEISEFCQQHMDAGVFALHVDTYLRMGNIDDFLLSGLSYGRYSPGLMMVLQKESDMTWNEMMGETLDHPDELLEEAARFRYTPMGM